MIDKKIELLKDICDISEKVEYYFLRDISTYFYKIQMLKNKISKWAEMSYTSPNISYHVISDDIIKYFCEKYNVKYSDSFKLNNGEGVIGMGIKIDFLKIINREIALNEIE
jgi:hypothetical protein